MESMEMCYVQDFSEKKDILKMDGNGIVKTFY